MWRIFAMDNIVYLQCDVRFNQWLLDKIDNKCVVEYTIDRCKKISGGGIKLIAGIYNCSENAVLMETLEKHGVDVRISKEEDVNKRFLDIVTNESAEYVIRVGGDQCLCDADKVSEIVIQMKNNLFEWFYESYICCLLPDIVSIACLRKYKTELSQFKRYFHMFEKSQAIKKYSIPYPILVLYNFRANSNEGFKICQKVIEKHLDVYELSKKLLPNLLNSNYLVSSGLWRSWIIPSDCGDFFYDEQECVNPWWGKSMIDFVKKRLNKSFRVFEWGSGNSTLFWSQNVKEVVSIEHNKRWYEKMSNIGLDNVKIRYCELEYGGEYSKAIFREGKVFDVVLIDGRDRVNCAKNAVSCLKEDGVIIWDNSERESYREGYTYLISNGFKQIEISSVVYGLPGIEEFTSIFYRENNCFGL